MLLNILTVVCIGPMTQEQKDERIRQVQRKLDLAKSEYQKSEVNLKNAEMKENLCKIDIERETNTALSHEKQLNDIRSKLRIKQTTANLLTLDRDLQSHMSRLDSSKRAKNAYNGHLKKVQSEIQLAKNNLLRLGSHLRELECEMSGARSIQVLKLSDQKIR